MRFYDEGKLQWAVKGRQEQTLVSPKIAWAINKGGKCPGCGSEIGSDGKCAACGHKVHKGKIICPKCKGDMGEFSDKCPGCGRLGMGVDSDKFIGTNKAEKIKTAPEKPEKITETAEKGWDKKKKKWRPPYDSQEDFVAAESRMKGSLDELSELVEKTSKYDKFGGEVHRKLGWAKNESTGRKQSRQNRRKYKEVHSGMDKKRITSGMKNLGKSLDDLSEMIEKAGSKMKPIKSVQQSDLDRWKKQSDRRHNKMERKIHAEGHNDERIGRGMQALKAVVETE